jgi:hypothetical protein
MNILAVTLIVFWAVIVLLYAALGYTSGGADDALVDAMQSACLYGFILYFIYVGIQYGFAP